MSKPIRFLIDALYRNATEIGSRPALRLLPDSSRTSQAGAIEWSQLAAWVTELADRLLSSGPLDRPIVHSISNSCDDVIIGLACQAAGIVEVPIDAAGGELFVRSCRDQVDGLWLDDEAKHELVDRAFASIQDRPSSRAHRASRLNRVGEDAEDALVLWTSGTSGAPKGVVLSHGSLLSNARAKLRAVPQSRSDVRMTVLSIAHAYARTCDLGTWLLSGCSLAITNGFEGWDKHSDAVSPSLCNMVPSIADRALDQSCVPVTLRLLGCGGAAMTTNRFRLWEQLGVTVIQGYGLTETGPVISSQTPMDSIAGHAGCFVEGWEHRLERGRLFVRGEHLMRRYWNDPASTSRRIDASGWLDTGDFVRVCESSGQLEILGRCDDRIVLTNGYNVDPSNIEKKVSSVSGIRTAVVRQCSDGRSLELWIESDELVDQPPGLEQVLRSLPKWEQPRRVARFAVPNFERERVFNRKGAIRRAEMLRYLSKL